MLPFNAAFSNELSRVFKTPKVILFFIIDLLVIGAYILLKDYSAEIYVAVGPEFSIHAIFFMAVFPLFIFMKTMSIFADETSDETITNTLIRPIERVKVYLAKICAICVFILAHILFVGLLMLKVPAFLISFIPMIAFVFFAAFISQLVKSGSFGMLVCLLFLLASYAAQVFMPAASAFLFVRQISLYQLLLTSGTPLFSIFWAFFIIAAYIILTFAIGVFLFERKDF